MKHANNRDDNSDHPCQGLTRIILACAQPLICFMSSLVCSTSLPFSSLSKGHYENGGDAGTTNP